MTLLTPCRAVAVLSLLLPLLFICLSIALSSWFNVYRNALSDLGHATRSSVALIFNLGLSLGGVLIVVMGARYLINTSRAMGMVVAILGYALVLIAVFDEVYGSLHFWVSVLFFISLAILLCIYVATFKGFLRRVSATIALILALLMWVMHLAFKQPSGAAIPELVSIAAVTPFYIDIAFKKACRA